MTRRELIVHPDDAEAVEALLAGHDVPATRWQRLQADVKRSGRAIGAVRPFVQSLPLLRLARRDHDALRERWQDEASEAAVAGKPERARYIEHMIGRLT